MVASFYQKNFHPSILKFRVDFYQAALGKLRRWGDSEGHLAALFQQITNFLSSCQSHSNVSTGGDTVSSSLQSAQEPSFLTIKYYHNPNHGWFQTMPVPGSMDYYPTTGSLRSQNNVIVFLYFSFVVIFPFISFKKCTFWLFSSQGTVHASDDTFYIEPSERWIRLSWKTDRLPHATDNLKKIIPRTIIQHATCNR